MTLRKLISLLTGTLALCTVLGGLRQHRVDAFPRPAQQQDQRESVDRLRETLLEAARLTREGKYAEAAGTAEGAQSEIARLAAAAEEDPRLKRLVTPLLTRLEVLRRVLDRNGLRMAAWPDGESVGTVSFVADLVPIFLDRCNNCHVTGARGGFSMANYESLMQGSDGGIVVRPGNVTGSRLVDVLENGDMPRGGGMLPAEQITAIKTWIEEGARFDGAEPTAALAQLAPSESPETNTDDMPAPELVKATGDEAVLFSRDIAPVLVEQCIGCHGANNPSGQLGFNTFARLLQGGQAGPIIAPGNAAQSLLIRKLKGEADGQRMPLRRPPLADDVMAKIEAWVADGAKFDGPEDTTPTATVAQLFRVSQMSFDELSAERKNNAEQLWRTAHPNVLPDRFESKNFYLMGTVGEPRLDEIAQLAEAAWPRVAQTLRVPGNDWPFAGRISWFVFNRRFEYSEFGRMAERREVPPNMIANRVYTLLDAYVAMSPRDPAGEDADDEALAPIVTEQLAGLYLQSLGDAPDWFVDGTARAVTARLHARAESVRNWISSAPDAKAQLNNANAILNGALPAEQAGALELDFAAFLSQNNRAFMALLRGLRERTAFDEAFQAAYRGTPAEAAQAWLRQ